MSLNVYSYLVIGLALTGDDVFERNIMCRCGKTTSLKYCPECGSRIKGRYTMKKTFDELTDEDITAAGAGDDSWYLVLRKYEVGGFGSPKSLTINLEEFDISPQEMAEFQAKAEALGVWNKDKFGAHLFTYCSR